MISSLSGPVAGDAQGRGAGGAARLRSDVQQPVAQLLRLREREGPAQKQGLGEGEQVDAGDGEFEPRGVDRELSR